MRGLTLSRRYRASHGWRLLGEFADLLALGNVTGDHASLRVNASAIVSMFAARRVTLEIVEHEGAAPLLIGRLGDDPALPTIGIYVHYDGQPTGAGWESPPFSPTLRDKGSQIVPLPGADVPIDEELRIFARGAADDKAPLIALVGALDVVRAEGLPLEVNLVFCFEGEEESGSPNLRSYLDRLAGKLRADIWVVMDGPVHHSGAPQVVIGVRGYCGFDLTVYGPVTEIHSGHYGNWAPNPAWELAWLLASFKGKDGNVAIEGFYESSQPLTLSERALTDALPAVEAGLLDSLGFSVAEVAGSRLAERLLLPSFNIRGLSAADVGAAHRNVIPSEASVSIDIRLVPGNDPSSMLELVREHIVAQGFHLLNDEPSKQDRQAHRRLARMTPHAGYPSTRASADLPMVKHLATLATAAGGREALTVPTLGGSLPLHHLVEALEAPTLILPIANHDNNQHAANENLRIGNLFYGIDLLTLLMTCPADLS